jgi:hypothetical protein
MKKWFRLLPDRSAAIVSIKKKHVVVANVIRVVSDATSYFPLLWHVTVCYKMLRTATCLAMPHHAATLLIV